jgi:hypothetical protein
MRGLPLDRVSSPDGHWQYTLYDGAGSHPFVHALDTEERRAKCIDLPAFPETVDQYNLRLDMLDGGAMLKVGSFATVDTKTFKVTPTSSRARPAPRKADPGEDSSAAPWIAGCGILLLAGGLALSLRSRRRARTRTATPA